MAQNIVWAFAHVCNVWNGVQTTFNEPKGLPAFVHVQDAHEMIGTWWMRLRMYVMFIVV